MSEGTPGRGPDADTRTGTGPGQGGTNGATPSQPVRYGPRNGSPRAGTSDRGATAGRTVPGTSSPQQYRSPQQAPTTSTPERTTGGAGANGTGSTAAGSNGGAANGGGLNGGANGRGPAGPASYTRPRPGARPESPSTSRPEQSDQDRQVAEARTAAAARNASASKGHGGVAVSGSTASGLEARAADDTTVIPKQQDAAPAHPGDGQVTGSGQTPGSDQRQTSPETGAEKGPGLRGLFRERRPKPAQEATAPAGSAPAAEAATTTAVTVPAAGSSTSEAPTLPGQASPAPAGISEGPAQETTEGRPLTWRDRLGLPPKAPKPQPVAVPDSGPGVPTAAAAAAVAASVAAGTAPPQTKASPTGPTTSPDQTSLRGPVTPTSPAPATSDTVVIPAVEAGAVSPAAPAAAATAAPLVTAKPKVGAARRTRKARLRLSRVDPWSVMKTALLFSIAAGIILVVATYGVWSVLNASGLFDAVNDMVKSVVSTPGDTTPFRIEEYVNTQKIIGVAALIAVVDVLIFTALATLGSFLYNLAATVLGGLEVTLAED